MPKAKSKGKAKTAPLHGVFKKSPHVHGRSIHAMHVARETLVALKKGTKSRQKSAKSDVHINPADIQRASWTIAQHIAEWWQENLKIGMKESGTGPLLANKQQLDLLYYVSRCLFLQRPVRIIILKARRMGISTAIQALQFYIAWHQKNTQGFTAAHKAKSTATMWRMAQLFRDEHPDKDKRPILRSNTKELAFAAPQRSLMQYETGGVGDLGRSGEIHFLHMSEVALMPHATETTASVMKCVSKNPNTFAFKESTANGATGQFYEDWKLAVAAFEQAGRNVDKVTWIPLFFSWLDFPEYAMAAPEDYEWGELNAEEVRLRDEFGATLDQLYWRRMTIADECGGDPENFLQEFPATADEAFLHSGRPAIPSAIVVRHRKTQRQPKNVIELFRDHNGEVHSRMPSESTPWRWLLFEAKVEGLDYAVGGDVMENILSDKQDMSRGSDRHAGICLNRDSMKIAAGGVGQILTDEFGKQLLMLAEWYNMAWGSPEVNSAGLVALKEWRDYPRLYQRPVALDSDQTANHSRYGWRTTTATRNLMIDSWLAHCRMHPIEGWNGQIEVPWKELVDEEQSFVVKPSGKREHDVGAHDDILFAAMIALQVHLDSPRQKEVVGPGRYISLHHDENVCSDNYPEHAFSGGVDYELVNQHEDSTTMWI